MADQNWWEEKDDAPEPKSGGLSEEESEMIVSLIKEKGGIGNAGPSLAIVEVNALLRDFARNREVAATGTLTDQRWGSRLFVAGCLPSLAYVIGVLFFGLSSTLEPIIPGYDNFATLTQACCFWPVFFAPFIIQILVSTDEIFETNTTLISELKEEYPYAAKHYNDASLFGRPYGGIPPHIRTSEEHQRMSWDWVTCSHAIEVDGELVNACSEKVPSWEGVPEGNRCAYCGGVFCPHHFIAIRRSGIPTTGVCNSCVYDA